MSAKQKRRTRYIRSILLHEAMNVPITNLDTSRKGVGRLESYKKRLRAYGLLSKEKCPCQIL